MITEIGNGLIGIKVPADAISFKFSDRHIGSDWIEYPDKTGCTKCPIPEGEYIMVGIVTKDHIGFDCEPYVEISFFTEMDWFRYKDYLLNDYNGEKFSCKTKEESFYSLLSLYGIYFVNPIKELVPEDYYEYHQVSFDEEEKSFNTDLYNSDLKEWQSYQDNLVEKLLIIQKIK